VPDWVPERARPFVRAGERMFRYGLTGRAAELAYYSMLALFPALIVLVSAIGLLAGQDDVARIAQAFDEDGGARGAVDGVVTEDTGAGLALGSGLLTIAYSTSLYTAAFARGAAAAQGRDAVQVPLKRRLIMIPATLTALLALGITLGALLVTSDAVVDVAGAVGLDGLTSGLLSLARWPLLVGILLLLTYGLYRLVPGEERGLRPSFGAFVAVATWLVASLGFAVYSATVASYDSTYGALGGVVSFLVWLWLSNMALLYGVALDHEMRDR
jgi:membrane protein